MTIKVTLIDSDGRFPFLVEFSTVKKNFTKKAAIELKNKLILALDDLEVAQAMKGAQ